MSFSEEDRFAAKRCMVSNSELQQTPVADVMPVNESRVNRLKPGITQIREPGRRPDFGVLHERANPPNLQMSKAAFVSSPGQILPDAICLTQTDQYLSNEVRVL